MLSPVPQWSVIMIHSHNLTTMDKEEKKKIKTEEKEDKEDEENDE